MSTDRFEEGPAEGVARKSRLGVETLGALAQEREPQTFQHVLLLHGRHLETQQRPRHTSGRRHRFRTLLAHALERENCRPIQIAILMRQAAAAAATPARRRRSAASQSRRPSMCRSTPASIYAILQLIPCCVFAEMSSFSVCVHIWLFSGPDSHSVRCLQPKKIASMMPTVRCHVNRPFSGYTLRCDIEVIVKWPFVWCHLKDHFMKSVNFNTDDIILKYDCRKEKKLNNIYRVNFK